MESRDNLVKALKVFVEDIIKILQDNISYGVEFGLLLKEKELPDGSTTSYSLEWNAFDTIYFKEITVDCDGLESDRSFVNILNISNKSILTLTEPLCGFIDEFDKFLDHMQGKYGDEVTL